MEPFGALLRRYRVSAALTQERLAERAGISPTGVAALEAGRRRAPRLSTVALLVKALDLDDAERDQLLAAAAGSAAPNEREPAAPTSRWRHSFVGRVAELERLGDLWRKRCRFVLLQGEAGVGKTRLTAEFADGLRAGGATILWGRCTVERLGPYEPFVDPVRVLLRDRRSGAATDNGELLRLVPEHSDRVATRPSHADPGVERRLLFEAVAALLGSLGPTLYVIDDIQWADGASFALLSHLAADTRLADVVVLGTVRSTALTPAAGGALADLRRHATLERVFLDGLALPELARLVGQIAGRDDVDQLAHTVQLATDGNPLFIEELTEHLLAGGFDPNRRDAGIPVPDGVQATIDRRVADLGERAQALLRAGAVLGRTFDIDLAGRLLGLDPSELLAATEDALLSDLVSELSASQLTFSHVLTQAAVYEATSTRRRLDLHRRAAAALEERTAADAATIDDIARHWTLIAASDPSAALPAARWAVRAGEAAAAAADIDEAIARYEQADALLAGSTIEHAETLVRLGSALASVGRGADADERFRRALRIAEALSDPVLQARAALGLAGTVRYGRSDAERIEALEVAIARLEAGDHVLRPAMQAMLMRQLGFENGPDAYARRQEAAAGVLAAVTAPVVADDLLLALGANRDSIPVDDPIVLGRLTTAQIELASARRELGVLANAWYGQAWSTLELGDRDGWGRAAGAYAAVAAELGLPYERALASTMAATTAQIEGRYADSEALANEALAHSAGSGDENASAVHLTNLVLRSFDQGHEKLLVELMLSVEKDYENVITFTGGLAVSAALAGDPALVCRMLDPWGADRFASIRRDAEWLPAVGLFAFAAGHIGHEAHSRALYDLLAPATARTVRVGPVAGWWGPVDHHLGVICAVLGRSDEAEQRLRAALAVADVMRARPFRARTLVELAKLAHRNGGPDGVASAAALASEAIAIAESVGADGITALARAVALTAR